MNFKTTYILFGVLIGILLLFLLAQLGGKKPEDQTAYVLPSLHEAEVKSDEINTVEIDLKSPKEEKLLFVRSGDGWQAQNPEVRAESHQLNQIVDQLMRASKDEAADLSSNLSQYGLDAPVATVILRKGGDKEWSVNIGKASIGKESALVYVTSSDKPKEPMAVRRFSLDGVIKDINEKGQISFKTLNDFRSKTLLADGSHDIVALSMEEPKRDAVSLEKTSDNHWKFARPAYGEADYEGEPLGTTPAGTSPPITGVRELLQRVADLRVETNDDFGTVGASDGELAQKGLEKGKERLRLEIKRQPSSFGSEEKKPAVTAALLIGNKADDKGDKLYACLESEKNLVKLSAKKVEEITKVLAEPAILRNKDLTEADSARVDAIDVKLNENDTVKLRKSGEPLATWKVFDSGTGQPADSNAVQGLLTALTAKRQVKEFPDAAKSDADLGFDKPSTVISLWVDGIKKEEKKEEHKDEKKDDKAKDEKKEDKAKDDKKGDKKDAKPEEKKAEKKAPEAEPALKDQKPTVRLVFGKKDKDLVYVRREVGTEVARLAVSGTLLEKVSAARLSYLDRKLPSYALNAEATRVQVTRGGQNFDIEKVSKEDKTSTWKLKEPKELAGRNADSFKVTRIIDDLQELTALKFITDKPSNTDLERYGLKTPALKATITIVKPDKTGEDFTFLFGKETDDKTGFYAKQGSRDLVFVVRKTALEPLEGDLQDPNIFTFALDKVKKVKFVGWQNINLNPLSLDLERKTSQNWVVLEPPNSKVDSNKVESLVASLTAVKALRFTGDKALNKPEYKLDPKDGALEIAITVEGEKDPITLTVGGPSGTDGFFARSNKLPSEIFVLPKGSFEQVKTGPAYFK